MNKRGTRIKVVLCDLFYGGGTCMYMGNGGDGVNNPVPIVHQGCLCVWMIVLVGIRIEFIVACVVVCGGGGALLAGNPTRAINP